MAAQSKDDERRGSPRDSRTLPVEVHFEKLKLLGPSANLSPEGVYFLAEATIPVSVTISVDGKKRIVKGRVVRVGSVNEKTLGVAVQFEEPLR